MSERFTSTHTRWIADEEIKEKKEKAVVVKARQVSRHRRRMQIDGKDS